jgi:hypothetical protein
MTPRPDIPDESIRGPPHGVAEGVAVAVGTGVAVDVTLGEGLGPGRGIDEGDGFRAVTEGEASAEVVPGEDLEGVGRATVPGTAPAVAVDVGLPGRGSAGRIASGTKDGKAAGRCTRVPKGPGSVGLRRGRANGC